ncbi:hypothetical protein L596_027980 [Steinernema carpocapsae]|uniref:Uncharacterized protein n=1 Tax=Steinernema carpocapsae TaxID=34508 RepID=A0A4V5ZXR4_STECR|nr:hypothetical protein L596_027980 [Steinernema carpocapsae]
MHLENGQKNAVFKLKVELNLEPSSSRISQLQENKLQCESCSLIGLSLAQRPLARPTASLAKAARNSSLAFGHLVKLLSSHDKHFLRPVKQVKIVVGESRSPPLYFAPGPMHRNGKRFHQNGDEMAKELSAFRGPGESKQVHLLLRRPRHRRPLDKSDARPVHCSSGRLRRTPRVQQESSEESSCLPKEIKCIAFFGRVHDAFFKFLTSLVTNWIVKMILMVTMVAYWIGAVCCLRPYSNANGFECSRCPTATSWTSRTGTTTLSRYPLSSLVHLSGNASDGLHCS